MANIKLFATIILLGMVLILQPQWLLLLKPMVPFLLGLIIFCIGLNTPSKDFKLVYTSYGTKILQISFLKFLILPLLAYVIAKLFQPPSHIFIGLMLLSASPGGTAACVMSHLSKANVSLTITLTLMTTLLTPIVLPLIIYASLNHVVSVNYTELFLHLAKIILIPLGLALYVKNSKIFRYVKNDISKSVPSYLIVLIITYIFAATKSTLTSIPITTFLLIVIFNFFCFIFGALISTFYFKNSEQSILGSTFEYGMFDTALTMSICATFFSPEHGIAAAIISVTQNVFGYIIANFYKKSPNMTSIQKV